jgi:hypothetical protein
MTLWSEGAAHGDIVFDRPATIPIMCSSRIVLRTDYTSTQPAPPPFEQPYPKDGLATSVSGSQRHRRHPVDPARVTGVEGRRPR